MLMMHINQMSLILLLSFLCFRLVMFVQPQLDPIEANVLRQIATTLGVTNPTNKDPCESHTISETTSYGENHNITCNHTDGKFLHVTHLLLKSTSLQGSLPRELANLKFLEQIDLTRINLSGGLPKEWASMQRLNRISINAAGISGKIPKEWGNFAKLTYLSLEANQLSGTIPVELGNLVNLTDLILSSNQFVGSLPKALEKLTVLKDFRISDNSFNGTVPEFIGSWTKLERLEMYSSGLEGPISPTIFALGNLTNLRISDMIGPKFDFPKLINKNMQQLVLRNLNMSGSIPTYIWDMGGLKTLDLTFNKLKGEINSNTTSPTYIFLSGNMLNGTIPNPFLSSTSRNFDLSYNNFTLSTDCPENIRSKINMYRSFTLKNNTNGLFSCPSTRSCSNYYRSFHINCGGGDVPIKGTTYEGDHAGNGPILSYDRQTNWGMISAGDFMDTEKNGYTLSAQTQVIQPELYSTARGSPLFLTYYGYCLENGNYKVNLHFAEIGFRDEEPYNRAGRRIFDIYIQGILKWKDFNIKEQANGTGKAIIRTINTVVTDNTLDIRLYWAGKGTTCIPYRGYYGPLISAISVSREPKKPSILYIVVGVVASVLCLVFFIMVFFFWRRYSRNKRRRDLKGLDLQTGTFTFKQLKAATDNFNSANKLGEGGFGAVYKGQLSDGTIIAVKQLSSKSRQGNREFVNEIGMISGLQHPNLVKLFGCCVEGSQLLLVYEYMENNCLADALFGSETSTLKLDWETRQKICVGIARGLAFLHEESTIKIVHRDIKATNVLLDRQLNAKISDFGLAKLKEEDDTHISTRVAGTIGYMAPLRQPLEHMFTSKEWDGSSWAKKAEGKEIKKIIFNDTFWGSMSYALKTTRPLVSVLRMTDSEKMPAMGFIYGAMDKAKEEIAANLGKEEGAYKEIWKIIDDKWEFQLHRHLHAAAYYLNPRFQYSDGLSTHIEVKVGLMVCMEKLIPDEEERVRANLQLNLFKNKQGFFSYGRAKNLIENLSPADWWSAYGDEAPELRSFAVKILSLTCSSSACERNWSTFNLVHTKKRNRLSTKKLNSLVYIMYNKKLQNRFLKKKALTDDDEPLVTEYVPSDDEWMVGEDVVEGTSIDVDMSQPSGSHQVGEKRKRNTNKGKALQRVDEEGGWEDISNQYNSPGTSDDDDGEDYPFDPHFKPVNTNDSLWDGLD